MRDDAPRTPDIQFQPSMPASEPGPRLKPYRDQADIPSRKSMPASWHRRYMLPIIIAVVVMSPLLIPGIWFPGFNTIRTFDRISGRLEHLDHASTVVSPDGKRRFTAERNGNLSLIDIQTGRSLQTKHIPTDQFRSVEAQWPNNQEIRIVERYRYPATISCNSGHLIRSTAVIWSGPDWQEFIFY